MEAPSIDHIADVAPAAMVTMAIVGITVWGTLQVIRFTLKHFKQGNNDD